MSTITYISQILNSDNTIIVIFPSVAVVFFARRGLVACEDFLCNDFYFRVKR